MNDDFPIPPNPRPRTRSTPDPIPESVAFDDFWAAYPRKVGKGGSRMRFNRTVAAGADPDAIIAAAEAFRDYCVDIGRPAEFIRYPARWLAERPWETTPQPARRPQRRPEPVVAPMTTETDPDRPLFLTEVPRAPRRERKPAAPTTKDRANAIARAYCDRQPLSSVHAVRAVVAKAIAAGRWSDREICAALEQIADAERTVTPETLRLELTYHINERRKRFERGDLKPESVVYIISADEARPVKIGTSEDVLSRLCTLQRSCPIELFIRFTVPGGYELETATHRHFKDRRIHGEWFDFGELDPVETVKRNLPAIMRTLESGDQTEGHADA